VIYAQTVDSDVLATTNYGHVQLTGGASYSLLGDASAAGVVTVTSGELDPAGSTLTLLGTGAPLVIGTGGSIATGAGVIRYQNGTGATIADTAYGRVEFGGGGTFNAPGDVTAGTLDVDDATFDLDGAELVVNFLIGAGTLDATDANITIGSGAVAGEF